jgi:hypothetical protein
MQNIINLLIHPFTHAIIQPSIHPGNRLFALQTSIHSKAGIYKADKLVA